MKVRLLIAILLFLLANVWLARQTNDLHLFNAVQNRLTDNEWYLRHVTQLAIAQRGIPKQTPRLIFLGSSQMDFGVDFSLIRQTFPNQAVLQATVGDMDASKALLMLPSLQLTPDDEVVLLISERDFRATPVVNANWMRVFATRRGLSLLIESIETKAVLPQWTQIIDLGMAAAFPVWKYRDMLHLLLFRAEGKVDTQPPTPKAQLGLLDWRSTMTLQDPDYQALISGQLACFKRLLKELRATAGHVYIFETTIHPSQSSKEISEMRSAVFSHVHPMISTETYCPLSVTHQEIEVQDWKDKTHLNLSGRTKLTRRILQTLHDSDSPPQAFPE